MALRERVFESLNSAIDNGYDLLSWTPEEVARDLAEYDADMENEPQDEVLAAVREWHAAKLQRAEEL